MQANEDNGGFDDLLNSLVDVEDGFGEHKEEEGYYDDREIAEEEEEYEQLTKEQYLAEKEWRLNNNYKNVNKNV